MQAVGGSTATVPAGAAPPPEAATDATDETGDDTSTNEEDDATESEFGMVDGESTPAFNPVNSTNSSVTGGCSIAVTINYACAAEDPTGAPLPSCQIPRRRCSQLQHACMPQRVASAHPAPAPPCTLRRRNCHTCASAPAPPCLLCAVYVYHLLTQDQAAGYCVNAATKKGYYCLKTFSRCVARACMHALHACPPMLARARPCSPMLAHARPCPRAAADDPCPARCLAPRSADITAGNVTLNVAEPGMWVYATSAEYDWPSGDSDVWMDLDGGESCSALGAAANDACTELVEVRCRAGGRRQGCSVGVSRFAVDSWRLWLAVPAPARSPDTRPCLPI